MKYFLFLISIPLLISCARDQPNTIFEKPKGSFEDFINAIPRQALPLELTCGLPDGTKSSEDFEEFKEFIPKSTDRIFGSIDSRDDNFKLVVFGESGDDIYPILYSFDNQGNLKDSLFLILHGCGAADDSVIPVSYVSISDDLTITMTDTTRLIHYPENESNDGYVIDSIRTSKVVMGFNKKGKFYKQ